MNEQLMSSQPTKVCSKCKVEKPVGDFYIRNDSRDGFRNDCKKCRSEKNKQYDSGHRKERKIYNKQYNSEPQNKEKNKLLNKQWKAEHKKEIKINTKSYYSKNKAEILLKNKKYRSINKDKIRIINKKYRKHKVETDINYRIKQNYRCRIYRALKENWKSGSTISLLGCSIFELKIHLEKQFRTGMTWDNWGSGHGKWNIDHIIPCSFFNMLDPVEQYMCFRWQNLQPLWWKDNREKSNKIIC